MPKTVTLSLETFERVVHIVNANAHTPFSKDSPIVQRLRDALMEDGAIGHGDLFYFAVSNTCAKGNDHE